MTVQNWLTAFTLVCAFLTAGCALGSLWALRHHVPRAVYRDGWVDGRIDLLRHMSDAASTGVPFDDFVRQVAARDGFIVPGD
jgi:hypothetical protein